VRQQGVLLRIITMAAPCMLVFCWCSAMPSAPSWARFCTVYHCLVI
jgi:hypothetical protein